MRRVLFVLASAFVFAACGGANPQDLGPPAGNGSTSSSSGGTTDGGSSGSITDGGSGLDAKSPGKPDGSSGTDSGPPPSGVVSTQITITDLFENCQPVVSADPIVMKGSITIGNGTNSQIGPISFPGGAFLNPSTLAVIATYKLKPVTMSVVTPTNTDTVNIEKQQNSATPANGCATLACGSEVIVEVDASGPGIPANAKIRTNPIKVGCAL